MKKRAVAVLITALALVAAGCGGTNPTAPTTKPASAKSADTCGEYAAASGETFYVGKGRGNRVFAHTRDELSREGDELSDKLKRIREIRLAGFEVAHVIHRHGMDDATAFEVEAALMDAYPGLTGIAQRPKKWRRRESNPRPRSRMNGFYERSRRSSLVSRSPRRPGCGGPASLSVPGSAEAGLTG